MARKTRSRAKSNSILNYVAVVLLTIAGLVLSFCSFNIPFTTQVYNGFANSIPLGIDFVGGISVVYDCSLGTDSNTTNLGTAVDGTVARLQNVISQEYDDVSVTRQGNSIRVEVPALSDANAITQLTTQKTPFSISTEEGGQAQLDASDVKQVIGGVQTENGQFGAFIYFNDEGSQTLADLTADASNSQVTLYIYLGDTLFQRITCDEQVEEGYPLGLAFSTEEQAQNWANQIMGGVFSADLDLSSSTIIPAELGTQAMNFFLIAGGVALLIVMILLWIRYGDFGLLTDFALVIYTVLMLFFMQAIPGIELMLTSFAGILFSAFIVIGSAVVILEKIRADYRSGMKIPLAFKSGFKRSLWSVLDSHFLTLLFGILLCVLGSVELQQFAFILLIGTVLSLFVNLVVLRYLLKWYLPFNSVKAKKLHMPNQIKHIKDEEVIIEGGQAND